jgi:hypothetical protein
MRCLAADLFEMALLPCVSSPSQYRLLSSLSEDFWSTQRLSWPGKRLPLTSSIPASDSFVNYHEHKKPRAAVPCPSEISFVSSNILFD